MANGQLFFRETGKTHDGKTLMMVVGVVAFDEPPKGEHQMTIDQLTLVEGSEIDRTKLGAGNTLGGMLHEGIWKV